MLPIIYRFTFDTPLERALLYLVAIGLVAYAAWNGWHNATGTDDTGEPIAPTSQDRRNRAITYGLIGAGLAALGMYYALPEVPLLGITGKNEGVPIHTYGLLIAVGFLSAVAVTSWLAAREWPGALGLKRREQVYDFAFLGFIGGIVGSRALFIIVNWKDYAAQPSRIFSLSGGLVFYGAIIGALIITVWYTRKNGIHFWRFVDIAFPSISLGQAFGRLGCFSAGCCWGRITKAPFAVEFPGAGLVKDLFGTPSNTSSLAFQSQSDAVHETRWVLESTSEVTSQAQESAVRISDWVSQHQHTLPVHPTQLYESLGQLLIFMFLLTLRRYRRFHGQIIATWLMCYAVLRGSVELLRGDFERGTLHGIIQSVPPDAWYNISTSQFISFCMFALGVWIYANNLRKIKLLPKVDIAALTAT